jgi:hypothetical protein
MFNEKENIFRRKILLLRLQQCSGYVTFWYISESADPYLWLADQDPAPTAFFKTPSKKYLLHMVFHLEGTFTSFFRDKKS